MAQQILEVQLAKDGNKIYLKPSDKLTSDVVLSDESAYDLFNELREWGEEGYQIIFK